MKKLLFCFALCACGAFEKVDEKEPGQDSRVSSVQLRVDSWLEEAHSLALENGWLLDDCDAFVWQGKLSAAASFGADPVLAESKSQPGRFGRRPPPACWDPDLGDVGAPTDWSRDQGQWLIYWSWRNGRLDILERHAAYGESSNWVMGEPFHDGRVYYSPALRGVLYQAIYALGGEDSLTRHWGNVYNAGLVDYEAHLQVAGIALRGEIAASLGQVDDIPTPVPDENQSLTISISGTMFNRLEEHKNREPNNPYFAAVWGKYSGNLNPAIELCLNAEEPVGEYVRCNDFRRCQLSELIHACNFVVRIFEKDWP